MNKFFKTALTFACTVGVSFSVAFKVEEIKANNAAKNDNPFDLPIDDVPLTNQQKLLASVTSMDGFNVEGGLHFTLEDKSKINIDLNVAGDISNFEDIKIKGDINIDLNGLVIPAGFGYFESTMFFNYRDNYFKLKTDNLLDFISMLPDYGVQMELPSELDNLDISTITAMIGGMTEFEGLNGDKYFILNLSEDFDLYVKTDSEYNFKGIRTDHIKYNNMEFYMDLDLTQVSLEELDLVSPKDDDSINSYQDFEPMFNLYKGIYNAFKGVQNTIRISIDLDKEDTEETSGYKDLLAADLDLSYDLDEQLFTLGGAINEKERHHEFDVAYLNKNIYVHMNNFKIAITTDSISNIISFVLDRVASKYMDKIMNSVSEMLNSSELVDTISNIDSALQGINITNNSFSINIDTDAVKLGMGVLTPTINFTGDHLESIVLNGLKFKGMKLDLSISLQDYAPFVFNEEEYEQFDPALTIVDAVMPLIEQDQFRIEFDAKVADSQGEKEDITAVGGLQFDVADKFGYGKVTITDRDDYAHTLKADMKSVDEILFSYNDTMNGKFKIATMMDLVDILTDIITNPDEHFMELFGELIDMIKNTPVFKAMSGDYGAIFDEEIINEIKTDEDSTSLDIGLGIIGYKDNNVKITINYNNDGEKAYLDSLNIKIDDFEGMNIDVNARLKSFSEEFASDRLDPYNEYMDFSDIKVLLELGINTSKFDYFHFSAMVDLKIPLLGSLGIDKKIPLDVKVRNDHGDVQAAFEFSDIPVINLVNNNTDYNHTKSRAASVYYQDEKLYLKRVDQVDKKIMFIGKNYEATYSAVYDVDYLLDNILQILLGDLLGMSDSIMEQIVSSDSSDAGEAEKTQIEYEKILKQFVYDETDSKFVFKVDLNALTHKDALDTIDLVVYEDKETKQLSGFNASIVIHVLINISISLDVTTQAKEPLKDSNKLTVLDSWVSAHSNDTLNEFKRISEVQK